jgi:predicted DNA repair protein MutK
MFLVGGGILLHGIPGSDHLLEVLAQQLPWLAQLPEFILNPLVNAVIGLAAGAVLVAAMAVVGKLRAAPAH